MKKFDKYLTRKNSPMPQAYIAILQKEEEMPIAAVMARKDINQLFNSGYLEGENGF